jgi:glyoxylase-like metal-dependent hydrolase (beta-lactamase superfamily II)
MPGRAPERAERLISQEVLNMGVVAEDGSVRVIQMDVSGGIVSNGYMLVCQKTGESVVIDTPGDAGTILKQARETSPKYILITHNHFDHLGGLAGVREGLGIPVAAHRLDPLPSPPDVLLDEGDTVSFGDVTVKVLHTPGHTQGSLCFLAGKFLVSGDTLFPAGPGRTGSPDALKQIIQSITDKILVLPDDTEVFSGHGDPTSLGKERAEIADFKSRSHDPNLYGDVVWLES